MKKEKKECDEIIYAKTRKNANRTKIYAEKLYYMFHDRYVNNLFLIFHAICFFNIEKHKSVIFRLIYLIEIAKIVIENYSTIFATMMMQCWEWTYAKTKNIAIMNEKMLEKLRLNSMKIVTNEIEIKFSYKSFLLFFSVVSNWHQVF